jgi:flagellar biosynthetic protein FliO
MKVIVQSLMVLVLFMSPAFAQVVSVPSANEGETKADDAAEKTGETEKAASAEAEVAAAEPVEEPAEEIPEKADPVAETAFDNPVILGEQAGEMLPYEVDVEGMQPAGADLSLVRAAGGLGIVLCLMIAAYFAARKFAPRYFSKGSSAKNLKLIETLSMGDKRSISIIEVANSRFLVGNTLHQINLLAPLPEPASFVSKPEPVAANYTDGAPKETGSPFRNLFEVEKKRPNTHPPNPLPEDVRTKMRQLREALER